MQPIPLPGQERLESIDMLRGFALFGIIAVNTLFFAQPAAIATTLGYAGQPDALSHFLVAWLAQSKFYGLFSFLFGLGFAIQMERWETRGPGRFRRRLLVLLGFGLLHGLLVWMGDILSIYALAGMALPWFRNAKPRTLIIWAICLLGLGTLAFAAMGGLVWLGPMFAPAEMARTTAGMREQVTKEAAKAIHAYGSGPYATLVAFRARELAQAYGMGLAVLPHIFTMFLLGLWAWKRGVFQNLESSARLRQRMLWLGLVLGLPLNFLAAWMSRGGMVGSLHGAILGVALTLIAAPLLTFGYIALLLRLLESPRWRRFVAPLHWSGRMALTNYLTQSLVMTAIFYFYGLGLYGKLHLHWSLLIALSVALAQVPLSRWWLSRYAMGPAEWLWRRLTYGRVNATERLSN
jgi:uncharacterized protein